MKRHSSPWWHWKRLTAPDSTEKELMPDFALKEIGTFFASWKHWIASFFGVVPDGNEKTVRI
jgi:hypothetical protein